MDYSNDGISLTEQSEGCKLKAYSDVVGVWTIGYGHTKGVKQGDSCTQAQAEAWLREDIQDCVKAINRGLKVKVSQGQFDALVDFAFNLGFGALEKSTLWKKLNAGDFQGAAAEFPKWNKAGGKVVSGLTKRRLAEQKLFCS
jgi:GH24 family phage-related lysozyme (muramidase)